MSDVSTQQKIDKSEVEKAISTLAKYRLHARLRGKDGDEAHRVLPEIWPVIQELCLIADACEAGVLQVTK